MFNPLLYETVRKPDPPALTPAPLTTSPKPYQPQNSVRALLPLFGVIVSFGFAVVAPWRANGQYRSRNNWNGAPLHKGYEKGSFNGCIRDLYRGLDNYNRVLRGIRCNDCQKEPPNSIGDY